MEAFLFLENEREFFRLITPFCISAPERSGWERNGPPNWDSAFSRVPREFQRIFENKRLLNGWEEEF
jgi:hypothetical protein